MISLPDSTFFSNSSGQRNVFLRARGDDVFSATGQMLSAGESSGLVGRYPTLIKYGPSVARVLLPQALAGVLSVAFLYLLVARRFDDATLDAWRAGLKESGGSGRWSFEEAFTRYEGFVRIGPRRGFHLLLVEEAADGSFTPVLP